MSLAAAVAHYDYKVHTTRSRLGQSESNLDLWYW